MDIRASNTATWTDLARDTWLVALAAEVDAVTEGSRTWRHRRGNLAAPTLKWHRRADVIAV